ncbi:MAG: efflux RND transporter periplasmic adaptor subunit [Muribaculum sp.]|nr:efflux RND transporter periplasmic adaptor subunit [Muribaculum sp.]
MFHHIHSAILPFLALSLIVLCGCKRHAAPTQAAPAKVDVLVIGADSTSGESAASYSGTVSSDEESVVSFSVPGTITNVYVKQGQKVAKGQTLARLKSESLGNEREIAVAELEQVQDLYNRLKKLHDQNALPDVKWVEVQAKLKQAKSAAALADRAVGDATISSPISGYVTEKLADEGQSIIPAQPILKITDIGNLQISIPVPEEEISRFGKNTTATVTFDALDRLTLPASLASKDVVADPFTRSYKVKFRLPTADGRILPGMIGNVSVTGLDSVAGVQIGNEFVVPSKAVLLASDNRQFVWIVDGAKAQRKYVEADELHQEGVLVKSGLMPGDSLIVAGMQKVSVGSPVSVTIKH